MTPPFSKADFLGVFARYNDGVWPAPPILTALAGVAVIAIVRRWPGRTRLVNAVLALIWLWAGLAYHMMYFADVNPIAIAFGLIFVAQALLFMQFGVRRPRIDFSPPVPWPRAFVGMAVLAYAIVFYPLFGLALQPDWRATPTFGTPCPVTLFTFAVLLWSDVAMLPRGVLIVPLLWAVIGTSAAIDFGIKEDWGLIVAALVTVKMMLMRGWRPQVVEQWQGAHRRARHHLG